MPPIDFSRRTALYRLFSADGRLLYVGVAFDPEARWVEHRNCKTWWPEVAHKQVEWLDSRSLALEAESIAIATEHPVHNRLRVDPTRSTTQVIAGSSIQRVVRIDDETWADFGVACEALGTNRSDELRRHVKAVIAAWKREQRLIARESTTAARD